MKGDASALERAEAELHELKEKLEHLAMERADEARRRDSHERLLQKRKMEALGRFAGGIAHDLNNAIFVISGNCDLMLFDAAAQPALEASLDEIKHAASRLAAVMSKLLTFSGKRLVQPVVLNPNAVLVDAETTVKRVVGDGVHLTIRFGKDLGSVRGDVEQLRQVILDLANAASEAMPQGGNLTIETSNFTVDGSDSHSCLDLEPGAYIELSVSDTGHGMGPEEIDQLFEPFSPATSAQKGSGLGLAPVYGAVTQWGGQIDVTSEPGQGTTFTICLPRFEETAETPERGGSEQSTTGTESTVAPAGDQTRPREEARIGRILVVDDSDNERLLEARLLRSAGHTVIEARSAEEALAALEREAVDAVVTDVNMIGMDGFALTEAIRRTRHPPTLPVIILSGVCSEEERARSRAVGATACLGKAQAGQGQLLELLSDLL